MRHKRALIALLTLGTIGGYAAGFMSLGCHAQWRHAAYERHVADVCVQAAREQQPNAR